ncbi:hypothetical protein [Microbacterium sp. P05]|uniref:hypothetical protein n=1 Tax=Microbacterium sp. P05 TaxID=3366948 RepID=UPI00374553CF
MSFFPPDADPPQYDESPRDRTPWWNPPSDEIPAFYPAVERLASTEHVSIALVGAAVYSDGVELQIERRLRRGDLDAEEWQKLAGPFMEHWHSGASPAARLRYGVVLGNAEKILDGPPFGPGGDATTPPADFSLVRRGGGGGGDNHSYAANDQLWLWPIPPAGTLELVLQWPAMGIGETHAFLDATSFRELAQQAQPFWP